jgi:hypothetical protein
MSGSGYRKLRNFTRTIAGIDLAVEADDSSGNNLVPARIHHVCSSLLGSGSRRLYSSTRPDCSSKPFQAVLAATQALLREGTSLLLRLMGKKLVALTMEGKFASEGLQSLDEDDDMLSAMARELIQRNGIGESADAVWKALHTEHQKQFPATSQSNEAVASLEARGSLLTTQSDPASLVEEAIDRGSTLIFGRRPAALSGRRTRPKLSVPEQASLFV